ncbi:MAG: hypothetical protein JEZ06_04365 [Anaerolineaceae bacterium]|nr:hypothetical protein [Anaerolineaceae bacterium]
MIIHSPQKSIQQGSVTISSRFEFNKPISFIPEELWYRFPSKFSEKTNLQMDAFAPSALLLAMYTGEDLFIKGNISPRIAYNLSEFHEIFLEWYPREFHRIKIHYENLEVIPPFEGETAVCTAFSGGVDSFYTLWSHIQDNQSIPQARLTHGVFIKGLDLRLEDGDNFDKTFKIYDQIYKKLGLELIPAATNAYLFSEFRIDWTIFFGVSLIGAALLLSPWMQRFYVPSGQTSYQNLFPQGSSPITDHLLSNEATDIVHHGTTISRFDKINTLVQWPVTHHRIRVCSDKRSLSSVNNCSVCHKCYRTMIYLELLNANQFYDNFKKKMSVVDFIRWGTIKPLNRIHAKSILKRAFQTKRYRIAFWIRVTLLLDSLRKTILNSAKFFLKQDTLFKMKRKIFKPENK